MLQRRTVESSGSGVESRNRRIRKSHGVQQNVAIELHANGFRSKGVVPKAPEINLRVLEAGG